MKCQKCGAELNDGVKFCCECGSKIELPKKRFCRECGAEFAEGAKFCSACGAKTSIDIEEITDEVPPADSTEQENVYKSDKESRKYEDIVSAVTDAVHEKAAVISEKITKKTGIFTDKMPEKTTSSPENIEKASSLTAENNKVNKKKILIVAAAIVLIALISYIGGKTSKINYTETKSTDSTYASENKVEVIDVINQTYSDAIKALQEAGFTNIVSNVENGTDESLWVVTGQNIEAGKSIQADEKLVLSCAMKCKLYIDITSECNLLFNTYDIAVSLDGSEIGSVANGEEFTYLADILTGKHELEFYKTGNTNPKGTKKLTITGDITYSCELSHDGSSISMKNENIENNVENATLEVVDVTGMVLSEAMKTLENIGFSNLREEPYGSIWDKDNWIVTAQSLATGMIADKNKYIQLDCISLDDYFSDNYVGKNVNEIQMLAEESGFLLRFEDSSWNDLNNKVATMDEETKADWIATAARQYFGADKTATVTIEYTGIIEQADESATIEPEPSSVEKEDTIQEEPDHEETASKDAVSYSTNSKDTVKDGNTGIYSYRNRGGQYCIYYIIDFDEGYVYRFCDGNGDTMCDRVKIVSGTLNDRVTITYHDGGDSWSYGICFKYANQPDHLIVQDNDGFVWDFYTTDIDEALALRDSKTIHDY